MYITSWTVPTELLAKNCKDYSPSSVFSLGSTNTLATTYFWYPMARYCYDNLSSISYKSFSYSII